MKPGFYEGIPNAEYHGGPGISKSGLDIIHRSPLHLQYARSAANDNAPTAAQFIGTAAHSLILEPAEFVKDYCLGLRRQDVPEAIEDREELVAMVAKLNEGRLPKLATGGSKADQIARIREANGVADGIKVEIPTEGGVADLNDLKGAELKSILDRMNEERTGLLPTSGSRHELAELLRANGVAVTLWSDAQAEWLKNNGTRTVLTPEQWDQLHGMAASVMAHPAANRLLREVPGKAEISYYWNDPATGELCRIRPDWLRSDDIIVDLKTTDDASPDGFAKSVANWRYDVQDAFYCDGFRAVTGRKARFVFIAVEKKPPYAVAVYTLDAESKEIGRAQYRADLDLYAQCKANDNWPGYGDAVQKLNMPGWHKNKNQHLVEGA